MKKLLFIFIGIIIATSAHAALLSPTEKVLLQKVNTTKLTFSQRNLVIKILNKYYRTQKFVTLKKTIDWILLQ